MAEKDTFLKTWEEEFKTTLKVLNAYPEDKLDLKPAEKSKTAKDLAWGIAMCDMFTDAVVKGTLMEFKGPAVPASIKEIVAGANKAHSEMVAKLKNMSDAEFYKNVKFFAGPGKMGDVPLNQVLWAIMHDHIHHRGQFSVYLRLAGAKVPSIYGPTADEPWN
jgi:uncharacterized damage-inducible protein DinB